jgi:hypothetical protein
MKNLLRLALTLGAAALLSATAACSTVGKDFSRVDLETLVVGKSTTADILRVMGGPAKEVGEATVNDQKFTTFRYVYARAHPEPEGDPFVAPGRSIFFTTFRDSLVGDLFVSSFVRDATDFDEARIPSIISGKTTRSDVLQLLGKPSGREIFPLLKIQGESRLIYSYARVRGDSALMVKSGMTTLSRTPTDLKTYIKSLVISFDANDIVSDVKFTSSGAK